MENVVYVVGAGFSRGAGVPVMSDFLFRAKDMYFADPGRYPYLKTLFSEIDRLNKIKGYYHSDLFNIEEILSVMEMQESIGARKNLRKKFIDMIVDVVDRYSYKLSEFYSSNRPGNWYDFVFSENYTINGYGAFVASLMNIGLRYERVGNAELFRHFNLDKEVNYSVVSFNYDMVLELPITYLKERSVGLSNEPLEFSVSLSKLHGSVHDRSVVPPTWSKTIRPELASTWKTAFANLEAANQIRIVGYSLPVSDSYFRYFLKSATVGNENLRAIDVLCFDPTHSVQRNYQDFVSFSRLRFCNARFEDYLNSLWQETRQGHNLYGDDSVRFNRLETIHARQTWS